MSGRVVHFEVPYDDGDRARSFYRDVFGWQLQEMPGMEYTLATSGPSGEAALEVRPDLLVTPLLAFDAFGGRLGQGGGYYDRTFAERPDTTRIGFGYAGQAVDRLALEPHDMRLNGVLTEEGWRAIC